MSSGAMYPLGTFNSVDLFILIYYCHQRGSGLPLLSLSWADTTRSSTSYQPLIRSDVFERAVSTYWKTSAEVFKDTSWRIFRPPSYLSWFLILFLHILLLTQVIPEVLDLIKYEYLKENRTIILFIYLFITYMISPASFLMILAEFRSFSRRWRKKSRATLLWQHGCHLQIELFQSHVLFAFVWTLEQGIKRGSLSIQLPLLTSKFSCLSSFDLECSNAQAIFQHTVAMLLLRTAGRRM